MSYYRRIAREVRALARLCQPYALLKTGAAQKFVAHADETDPGRLRTIFARTAADVAWVLQKYARKET